MPDCVGAALSRSAPRIGEKPQRARRGDDGSFWRNEPAAELRGLTTSAPRPPPGAVELEEVGLGHVDFAADLAHRGNPAPQLVRNLLDGPDIGGDVLAFGAVAARRRHGQLAVLVAERHRETVIFGSAMKASEVLFPVEKAADAHDEILHVLLVEGVCSDSIGTAWRILAKPRAGARRPCASGYPALSSGTCLDRVVAPPQRVVFGVGNGRASSW